MLAQPICQGLQDLCQAVAAVFKLGIHKHEGFYRSVASELYYVFGEISCDSYHFAFLYWPELVHVFRPLFIDSRGQLLFYDMVPIKQNALLYFVMSSLVKTRILMLHMCAF